MAETTTTTTASATALQPTTTAYHVNVRLPPRSPSKPVPFLTSAVARCCGVAGCGAATVAITREVFALRAADVAELVTTEVAVEWPVLVEVPLRKLGQVGVEVD